MFLFCAAAEGTIMMTCGLTQPLPLSGTSRGIALLLGKAMVDASSQWPVIKLKLSHVPMHKPSHSSTKFDFDGWVLQLYRPGVRRVKNFVLYLCGRLCNGKTIMFQRNIEILILNVADSCKI